jgi:hypothetical protein
MIKPSLLLSAACMAAPIPALAQQAPQAIPTVEVRHQLPVATACPTVFSALPAMLSKASYEIGEPADVLVKFTLAGGQMSDLYTKSSYWAFRDPVRRALRKLPCHSPDQEAYTVQFRIIFRYDDEPGGTGSTAYIEPDFAPALVRR